MNELCTLEQTPDCPFTAAQINALNRRFKAGYKAALVIRQEQESNYQSAVEEGLLKDLAHKAAISDCLLSSALGNRWHELRHELDLAEASGQTIVPAALDPQFVSDCRDYNCDISIKEHRASSIAVQVVDCFRQMGGYESLDKLRWLLERCPAGYFSYTLRRAIEHHEKQPSPKS